MPVVPFFYGFFFCIGYISLLQAVFSKDSIHFWTFTVVRWENMTFVVPKNLSMCCRDNL